MKMVIGVSDLPLVNLFFDSWFMLQHINYFYRSRVAEFSAANVKSPSICQEISIWWNNILLTVEYFFQPLSKWTTITEGEPL